jgi:hypothetical protein
VNTTDPRPISILLQTTIRHDDDNWNIDRFSMLRDLMSGFLDRNAKQLTNVTARDREADIDGSDPVLSSIASSDFDQVWLIGVDGGDDGLSSSECEALTEFRRRGGAIMSMRDHQDLGASICYLGGIGKAHHFHTTNPEPGEGRDRPDDADNPNISWPNYHSGSNGDVQCIKIHNPVHSVLYQGGGTIRTLPAHPHEGAVGQPPGDSSARVVVSGTSSVTQRPFNIAVAFEMRDGMGRGWAESTFHHFADYNWDTSKGCPSFVTDVPSRAVQDDPALLNDTKRYVRNLVEWLGRRRAPAQSVRGETQYQLALEDHSHRQKRYFLR